MSLDRSELCADNRHDAAVKGRAPMRCRWRATATHSTRAITMPNGVCRCATRCGSLSS